MEVDYQKKREIEEDHLKCMKYIAVQLRKSYNIKDIFEISSVSKGVTYTGGKKWNHTFYTIQYGSKCIQDRVLHKEGEEDPLITLGLKLEYWLRNQLYLDNYYHWERFKLRKLKSGG